MKFDNHSACFLKNRIATSKQFQQRKEKKAQKDPSIPPPHPEVKAPSRAANSAPVSPMPASVESSAKLARNSWALVPAASPLSDPGFWWWFWLCFEKSEMPIGFMAWPQAARTRCMHPAVRGAPPAPALPLLSARTPQTGLSRDVPFLWFFCLFWVYTIIKKSLVLAGNLKNKTKQRNHPPLAYSSSIMTWLGFCSTLRVGVEGWELHSKKRRKGRRCSF